MFVLRNLGINLNDYKIHRSRYSRDDQKRIDAGWRMLDTIAFMNKNSISTVSQAREFENINIHKIEHYELIRKKFRNKLYVARRF
ncbi:MAG: hypothetical protein LKM40_01815 [Mageeibacillus sp.]|jgi:hypothetical protein|nr:hypothetical protein [Mageeibacillus sp.]